VTGTGLRGVSTGTSIGIRGVTAAFAAVLAASLLVAPAALGNYHLMKIREISGSTAGSDSAYVELQMTAAGQNLVVGHRLHVYNEMGTSVTGFVMPSSVPFGENQRTVLIGDTGVPNRDLTWDALSDLVGIGQFGDAGGLCFSDAHPADCVTWGTTFTGLVPDRTPPFPGPLPATLALQRSISGGCPTLLEHSDDHDLATDFALVPRAPTSNATAPVEKECPPADTNPPQTKIKKRPKNRSGDGTPTYKFKSDESGSTFKCKLDRKKFRKCKSPKTYRKVKDGNHRFTVKAIDAAGNEDRTPAKDRFVVVP
jgi:hypothetical protein